MQQPTVHGERQFCATGFTIPNVSSKEVGAPEVKRQQGKIAPDATLPWHVVPSSERAGRTSRLAFPTCPGILREPTAPLIRQG